MSPGLPRQPRETQLDPHLKITAIKDGCEITKEKMGDAQMTADVKRSVQKEELWAGRTVGAVNKATPFQSLKLVNTAKDIQRKRRTTLNAQKLSIDRTVDRRNAS